jgi:signal transduction histidine kinase/CheY-like chemotaxis protein
VRVHAYGKALWRPRWLSVVVVAAALVLGLGMFSLSRTANQRDEKRLVTLQAQDAKTAFSSLIGQIESSMSSLGSVAAATNSDPAAMEHLAAADPSVGTFSVTATLHRSATGRLVVTSQRGNPSAPLPGLGGGAKGRALTETMSQGGFNVLGFFGSGERRRLAVAEGAPLVPGGYVVYAELPLPGGTTVKSSFPSLQYALYTGPTSASPVLIATTKNVPLTGDVVSQLVDLNDLDGGSVPKAGSSTLLFVVSISGTVLGTLSDLLPWILAGVALLAGLLVAFVLEATSRRKDQALALVAVLEQKNIELDQAIAEQRETERTRVRLEGELRQAQRMEAVGRLAGGVAHDFNNLLAVILTYGEFIADELGTDHPLQADVAEVRKAARRAADLTRQLLVFSRRDLVTPSVLDVNEAINNLLNLLHRTLGEEIALRTVLGSGLPRVIADAGELEQILVNLAVNARDAIAGTGTITVETSEQMIDEDASKAHADLVPGRYIRINVTDTGCGMNSEVASQVFEPFFTTKGPGAGTGLGLSTVYAIANRYGGCVTVYSEVGVGTTFKVYLPTTDEVAESEVKPAPSEEISSTGETVLLVEDEDAVRSACRRILERAGFNVLEASNGAQALAEVAEEPIDLLLTDVVMPGGLSGRELANSLQQNRPGLKVLFMSGYNADAIATRGILDPGIVVVEKPFTTSDLLSKVREVLV